MSDANHEDSNSPASTFLLENGKRHGKEVEKTSYVHIKINLSFIDESLLTSLVFILAY